MLSSIYFQSLSLIYIILLIIIYFTKKHLSSIENTIFSILIVINCIGLILDIASIFTIINMDSLPLINVIITKLYLIYLLTWISLLTLYIYTISFKDNGNNKSFNNKFKIVLKFEIIMYIISVIIVFALPLYYFYQDNIIYSYGPSSIFLYVISSLYILSWIYCMIKNFKNIKNKKYLPMFAYMTIGIVVIIIQGSNPSVLLMTSMESFIVFLMYFTIENPDLQMLKEFHKARELAEESNKEKTEFLFNISNQIKTPINKIIETSEKALNKNDVIEIKNDVRTIKGNSNNLLNLVNNVLDISDEEIRQIEIRGNKYNIKRLFETINKKYEKNIKVEYRFKYDNSIPEYLYGDSMRIKQIMNILLENAIEYTNVGYIETSVNSIIKNNICRLVITVEDSGKGMDTEEIKHLFDKEKIYEDEVLKEIDDTKNNLSMLKAIVNLMNGNVLVESNIGVGSKFTVIIDQKVLEEKTKIIKTVEEYEEMYEQNKKIIIVTDREEISKKINKILRKEPYEIEIVTLGQTCLERMRKGNEYDLIIIDESIPKLSSEDTLNKIKDTKCYKKPVILITKNKEFGSREMYQEKGFKDIIIEPIKKEEIINIVKEYIDK